MMRGNEFITKLILRTAKSLIDFPVGSERSSNIHCWNSLQDGEGRRGVACWQLIIGNLSAVLVGQSGQPIADD